MGFHLQLDDAMFCTHQDAVETTKSPFFFINGPSAESPVLMEVVFGSVAGVALRRQHGGPALLQGGSHRAQEEALQQQHRFLHQAQRPASG